MDISRIDLNLLVYLDVLLREQNVTRAANQLGITQPAMSNSLRRLRELFNDPLLVRTSEGMAPTARANELQPQLREILGGIEKAVLPVAEFDHENSQRMFRIMASDYAESTLFPLLLDHIQNIAPHIRFDILTPSDVVFQDLENGKIDMAVNRFSYLPQSFHQVNLWQDDFACLMNKNNPLLQAFNLDNYLAAAHIWVNKTGMGVSVGVSPSDIRRLGWVDEALGAIGKKRNIKIFTRHYQVAGLLARQPDLVATLPKQIARNHIQLEGTEGQLIIMPPPFSITPIELTMAWSPLLQHDPGHLWMRRIITDVAKNINRTSI